MAITWETTITPLNVAKKEAQITAVRTDDTDGSTQTCRVDTAIIDTAAQKTAVADEIWAQHLRQDADQTAISNYIGTLEADLKANLEARE